MLKRLVFLSFACIRITTVCSQDFEIAVQKSGGGYCADMAISDDGLIIAKADETTIDLWNTKTGCYIRTIRTLSDNTASVLINKKINEVRFWQKNKFIITGTINGLHEIYYTETGKLYRTINLRSYSGGVFAASRQGIFVTLDELWFGKDFLRFLDLYTNTEYDSVQLNLGAISALEFSPDGSRLVVGTELGGVHILQLDSWTRKIRIENAFSSPITKLQWSDDNYLLCASADAMFVVNLNNNQIIRRDSFEKSEIIIQSPVEDSYYQNTTGALTKISGDKKVMRSFGIPSLHIDKVVIAPNGNILIQCGQNTTVWNNNNLSVAEVIQRSDIQGQQAAVHPINKALYYIKENQILRKNQAGNPVLLYTTRYNIQSMKIAANGNIAISTADSVVVLINDKPLYSTYTKRPVHILDVHGCRIIASDVAVDSIMVYINCKTSVVSTIPLSGSIKCGRFSDSANIAVAGDKLYLVQLETGRIQKLYDPKSESWNIGYLMTQFEYKSLYYTSLCFMNEGKTLAAYSPLFNTLKMWNTQAASLDTIIQISISDMGTTHGDKTFFIATENQIRFLSSTDIKIQSQLILKSMDDYVFILPSRYYKATPTGASSIAYVRKNTAYSFDQLDAIFNRPDIVLKEAGNPSDEFLKNITAAVEKRQMRLGNAQSRMENFGIDFPDLIIPDLASIPSVTTKNLLTVKIFNQCRTQIQRFMCYVNGTPANTSRGVVFDEKTQKASPTGFYIDYSIGLDPGYNHIEFSSITINGIESPRESIDIFYKTEAETKPDLYFIGVGTANYLDSNFNLKYPEKDIADVENLWMTKKDQYRNIYTKILTGENVSTHSIRQLYEFLHNTNTNDEIIIYWSGHGLIGEDFNYYLATYSTDFDNPSSGSVPYEMLEGLLDSATARRKLLFLDACHSGEIDKDEIVAKENSLAKIVNTKGNNVPLMRKESVRALNNLTLELFTDVCRRTGADIISAAGGAEFAVESDVWQNGVFTYALIRGLTEMSADLNNDGKINISELQVYLERKVIELTGGLQRPTSRSSNIITDRTIW